ncbi:hypothetical protein KAU45_10650 [bacterium]|nr:hypothetical protein [bacterium]
MKRLLPLIVIVSLFAAEEEMPLYPLGLGMANETILEEIGSLLRVEGWVTEAAEDNLSLRAERGNQTLKLVWLDETYLKEVTYTELWDDAWDGKDRYDEWLTSLETMYDEPLVDDETFHYWMQPGEEIWIEVVESSVGTATLTFNLTFL